MYSHLIGPC